MKQRFLFLALIALLMMGCEESFESQSFPKIVTLQPVDDNSTRTTLGCKLLAPSTSPTTSYGFLISTYIIPDFKNSAKIELGENIPDDGFDCSVNNAIFNGNRYYIMAFATTGDKTIFGNIVVVKTKSSKEPL